MAEFRQKGGCQCGRVRYVLNARPEVIYCCHCTECQKQSSSAFGISVRVEAAAVEVTGTPSVFERPSASGLVACDFCVDCGSRLFHRRPGYGERMNIKGGTFDETAWIRPAGHIWTASKQAWLCLPEGDLKYDNQPPDYEELIAIYAASA